MKRTKSRFWRSFHSENSFVGKFVYANEANVLYWKKNRFDSLKDIIPNYHFSLYVIINIEKLKLLQPDKHWKKCYFGTCHCKAHNLASILKIINILVCIYQLEYGHSLEKKKLCQLSMTTEICAWCHTKINISYQRNGRHFELCKLCRNFLYR